MAGFRRIATLIRHVRFESLPLLLLVLSLNACDGGNASTSTSSDTATTTGASSPSGETSTITDPAEGSTEKKATSPAACVRRWNTGGVDPDLTHVLIPTVRVAGPFAAEIGVSAGNPEVIPPDVCVVIVHAKGVEGSSEIRYTTSQSSPQDRFVQSPVSSARALVGTGRLAPATLDRDGSLELGR
jgi:hypothetical protein